MKGFIRTIALLISIAGIIACSAEMDSTGNGGVGAMDVTVRAITDYDTKTSLSGSDELGYAVLWQTNDEIAIGGKKFRLISGAGTKDGVFQLVSGTAPGQGEYYAYYPSTYSSGNWPTDQEFVEGNISGIPMKASVVVSEGGTDISDLHFTNEGGILRLTVKGSSDIEVKSVTVIATELAKAVTLTCATPVALNASSGVDFHISLPENTTGYSNFSVSFKDSDGNVIDTKSLKNDKLVVRRSSITRASFEIHRTATLKVATYNVDGLPVTISLGSIIGGFVKGLDFDDARLDDNYNLYINDGGPGSDGTKAIGEKIAVSDWDVFGLNEDFNYHEELTTPLNKIYSFGTHQGRFPSTEKEINFAVLFAKYALKAPLFDIDGLGLGAKKSCCSIIREECVPWDSGALYGYLSNSSDELTKKGFRYYTVSFNRSGVQADIDFIVLHADAGSAAEDISAREVAYSQLVEFIKGVKTGNPIIIMGDFNTRYRRDNFKKLFLDKLNGISGMTATDAWVEYNNGGSYPQYANSGGHEGNAATTRDESLDKIIFVNRDKSPVELKLVFQGNATDFIDGNGAQLSDHLPAVATFKVVCRTK